MYKAQYKLNNTYNSWITIGSYSNENQALAAIDRKRKSTKVFAVRIVDKNNNVIFTQL